MTNNHPDQIDELTELRNEVSASIYGQYYYELAYPEQRSIVDSVMKKAHAAVKVLMLKRCTDELKAVLRQDPDDFTTEWINDRIKNLEGEIEGMNHG